MIDTSKPIEMLTTNGNWVPARFLAMTSVGTVVLERDGLYGVTVSQFPPESLSIRNRPEPKRRPLNEEEMRDLTGLVLTSEDRTLRTSVVASCGHYMMIGLGGAKLSPNELMSCGWRRLDGSGLWVEE